MVDVDAGGNPIFGGPVTRLLEGDIVLSDGTWIDAKHGPQTHIGDLRIWNQIVKAQAAINQGLIPDFRFEVSGSMHNKWVEWAAQNAPGVEFISNLGDSFR